MGTLILTIGLPRSGKTTWARSSGEPMVNPDSIRIALHGRRFWEPAELFVWATAYTMVEALFRAGHGRVIVDACNVTLKRRDPWMRKYECDFRVFLTRPEVCIERAVDAGDTEIVPVIERMAEEWDYPQKWS
jgi:predicted kinase